MKRIIFILFTITLFIIPNIAFAQENNPTYVRNSKHEFNGSLELDNISLDRIDAIYTPIDKSVEPFPLATAYVIKKTDLTYAIQNRYEMQLITDNYALFYVKHHKHNFSVNSLDYKKQEESINTIDVYMKSLTLNEVDLSKTQYYGKELRFVFETGIDMDIIALTDIKISDEYEESFTLYNKADLTELAEIHVYKSSNWSDSITGYKKHTVIFDYVFAYKPYEGNIKKYYTDDEYLQFNAHMSRILDSIKFYDTAIVSKPIERSDDKIRLAINLTVLDEDLLVNQHGYPLFPLRTICEAVGYDITWNETNYSFTILNQKELLISKRVDRHYDLGLLTDESEMTCYLINGVTYVNMVFIIDILDCKIGFNNNTYVVSRK